MVEGISNHVIYRRKNKRLFLMTVVPPDFRSEFISPDRSDWCFLSTELLYPDSVIVSTHRTPAFREGTVWYFSGNKMPFFEWIEKAVNKGDSIDFAGFKPTWGLIDHISRPFQSVRCDDDGAESFHVAMLIVSFAISRQGLLIDAKEI